MLTALASEPQYLATLAPIWVALPPSVRGEFLLPDHLWPTALAYGIEPAAWHTPKGTCLVASYRDLGLTQGHPAILAEHGAGQTYQGCKLGYRHPNYAGGTGRDDVILFLCPGEANAEANRDAYPDTPAVVIGNPRYDRLRAIPVTNHEPTAAVAFHWSAGVCPESGTAWYHWRDHLDLLTDAYPRVLGTGHPRAYPELIQWYEAAGIIPIESFDVIVAEADVLVADNTGVMYDWAALDRPVVALNAPEWRRTVNHGLRFWDAIPGLDVDDPVDLPGALDKADSRHARRLRARAVRAAYGHLEGSALVAADAIMEVL